MQNKLNKYLMILLLVRFLPSCSNELTKGGGNERIKDENLAYPSASPDPSAAKKDEPQPTPDPTNSDLVFQGTYNLTHRRLNVVVSNLSHPILDLGEATFSEPQNCLDRALCNAWSGDGLGNNPLLAATVSNEQVFAVNSLSGDLDFNTASTDPGFKKTCDNLVHEATPTNVVLVQFTNASSEVQNVNSAPYLLAASSTAKNGVRIPTNTTSIFLSVPDVSYADNSGTCTVNISLIQTEISLANKVLDRNKIQLKNGSTVIPAAAWSLNTDGNRITIDQKQLTAANNFIEVQVKP